MHNQKKAYGPPLNEWSSFAHTLLPTQFKTLSTPTDSLNSTYAFVHAFDA